MASSIASARSSSPRLRAAGQLDRALRPPESSLDVRHHRQVPGPTAHPPGGPQLAEGLAPLTGVVGGDAGGLADGRDPRRPVPGVARVRQRLLGIVVDERPRGDEVARDGVGRVLLQTRAVPADRSVQFGGGDVVGQRRLGHSLGVDVAPPGRTPVATLRPEPAHALALRPVVVPHPVAGAVRRPAVVAPTVVAPGLVPDRAGRSSRR